jgi:DNA modification methylase
MKNPSSPRFSSIAPKLVIKYRLLDELKPNPLNPRRHTPKQIKQLAKAIYAFGFSVTIAIDGNDTIFAGHGRLLASKELKWKEIPTICIDHLNDAQKRAFMIADNRLNDASHFDETLLNENLQLLANADINLELTGFDMGEIDFRIENRPSTAKAEKKNDRADDIPRLKSNKPVSQLGEIWRLGEHRIICGNTCEAHTFEFLLGDQRADLIFSDPPYNVRIKGHVKVSANRRQREFAMAAGEMDEHQFTAFLSRTFGSLARSSKKGSIHFVCMDWRHMPEMLAAAKTAYSEIKNLCVWVKDNAGMGSFYRSKHELIGVFKNGRGQHTNNIRLGVHGRSRTNVWSYPGVGVFGRGTDEGKLAELHPTIKPVALVADAILDCSNRGDLVLDAFLGSGTTLIAAQRTGRRCYGIEIDPLYVDTIIRRYQAFTGDHATLEGDGRTFNQIEKGQ